MDQTEIAQITTIAGAVIAAALNFVALYQGGRVEARLGSLVDSIRDLNQRLDRLTSDQFQALLGYIQQLTENVSEKLVRIDERVGQLLQRQ